MQSTLFTPSAEAASSSPSSAMRLRSRPVTWSIGSNPLSSIRWAAEIGAIVMLAPAESVRLKASTMPFSASACLNRTPRSVPFGGFSSAVTTNLPDLSDSENVGNSASLLDGLATQAMSYVVSPLSRTFLTSVANSTSSVSLGTPFEASFSLNFSKSHSSSRPCGISKNSRSN